MAAITSAVVAGAGALMSMEGARAEASAASFAGRMNADEAARQAKLAEEKAIEDEKQFRLSFRRDVASNEASISVSGIKLEGSPMEVLRDNAAMAEEDAQRIRRGGDRQRDSFRRQATGFRFGAQSAKRAGRTAVAGEALGGAGRILDSGAFDAGD